MRVTQRERRLALTVAAVAVAALAALWLFLPRGSTRPSDAKPGAATRHPPSASASPHASGTEPAGPRAVKAGYSVRGRWDGGFNAEVVVTNLSSQPLEGWTVRLELPSDVAVTSAWSAEATQVAGVVTLRSQPWNTYVAPGGTVHMGFQAKGGPADPRSCTVNGVPCGS
jgi:cellulase/cellobiase CelA1